MLFSSKFLRAVCLIEVFSESILIVSEILHFVYWIVCDAISVFIW